MSAMRTVFVVLAPPGSTHTAMAHNVPVNQTLESMLQVMLALPATFQSEEDWGTVDTYLLRDLYGQDMSADILVQNVPFPGVIIAASKAGRVQLRGEMLRRGSRRGGSEFDFDESAGPARGQGRQGLHAVRPVHTGRSLAFRADSDHGRRCRLDLSHRNRRPAAQLLELLKARGLRCKVRVVKSDGSSSGLEAAVPLARMREHW